MAKDIIFIAQIILGLLLVILILLQNKGTGLGATFGSSMSFYSTRRGAEKIIFILTIVVATLFLLDSILGVVF